MIFYLRIFVFLLCFTESLFGSLQSAPRKGLDSALASRGVPEYLLPSNLTMAQREIGFLLKDLHLSNRFAGIWPARVDFRKVFPRDHISALLAYAFPYDSEGALVPNTRSSARISHVSLAELGSLIRVLDAHEPEAELSDTDLGNVHKNLVFAVLEALGLQDKAKIVELDEGLEGHRVREWQAQMVKFGEGLLGQIDPSDMEEDAASFRSASSEGRVYSWLMGYKLDIDCAALPIDSWDSPSHVLYSSERSRAERTKRSHLQKLAFAELLAEAVVDVYYCGKQGLVQKVLAVYGGLRAKSADESYALYAPWMSDTLALTRMPSFTNEEKAALLSRMERADDQLYFWRGLSAEQQNAVVYQLANNAIRFATLPQQGTSKVMIDGREKSFSDCFESSMLAFLATTLADTDPRSGTLTLCRPQRRAEEGAGAAAEAGATETPIGPFFSAYHNFEMLNTQDARNAFAQLLSGIAHVDYEQDDYEVTPSFANFARLIRHLFGQAPALETATIKDELAAVSGILSTHTGRPVVLSLDDDESKLNGALSQNMWGDLILARDGVPVFNLSLTPGHASWQRILEGGAPTPLDRLAVQILDQDDPTFLQSEGFLRIVPFLNRDNMLRASAAALKLSSAPLLAMVPTNQAHTAADLLAQLFAESTRARFSSMAFSKATGVLHFLQELWDQHVNAQIFAPVKAFCLSDDCTPELFERLMVCPRLVGLRDPADTQKALYDYLCQTRPDLAPLAATQVSSYTCVTGRPLCPFILAAMAQPQSLLRSLMIDGTTTGIEDLSPDQRAAMSSLKLSYVSFSADSSLAAVMPQKTEQLRISAIEKVDPAVLQALVSRFEFTKLELSGSFLREGMMAAARAIHSICEDRGLALSAVFKYSTVRDASDSVMSELFLRELLDGIASEGSVARTPAVGVGGEEDLDL